MEGEGQVRVRARVRVRVRANVLVISKRVRTANGTTNKKQEQTTDRKQRKTKQIKSNVFYENSKEHLKHKLFSPNTYNNKTALHQTCQNITQPFQTNSQN